MSEEETPKEESTKEEGTQTPTVQHPVVEKQMMGVGTPFKVLAEPRVTWKTGYFYYLHQITNKEKVKPLYGRYVGETDPKQFQVMEEGEWINKNYWDYAGPVKDKDGNIENNAAGKPKIKPFFEEKHDWLLEFQEPTDVEYWDKELKQTVNEPVTTCYLRTSTNLSGKISEQRNDPRNGPDTKFIMDFDKTKAPADMYKVRYSSD